MGVESDEGKTLPLDVAIRLANISPGDDFYRQLKQARYAEGAGGKNQKRLFNHFFDVEDCNPRPADSNQRGHGNRKKATGIL